MPSSLGSILDEGLKRHQAGRLQEAAGLYRLLLVWEPGHADALHFLGVLAMQSSGSSAAGALIGRAIIIDNMVAAYHSHFGVTLKKAGRQVGAIVAYRLAICLRPDYAEPYSNLGNILVEFARFADAAAACRLARRLRPDFVEACTNLANALTELGCLDNAATASKVALLIRPDYAEAYANLGNISAEFGRFADAAALYDWSIRIRPDFAEGYANLANVLTEVGRLGDAVVACKVTLLLRPDHGEAYSNLGVAKQGQCLIEDALRVYDLAIRVRPDFPEAFSNLLMAGYYREGQTGEDILAAAQRYGAVFASVSPPPPLVNQPDPKRRLRVGYVSGDFFRHPVGYFLAEVLAHHEFSEVEAVLYSTSVRSDDLTSRLRGYAKAWRSLVGLNDEAAAGLIRADVVDILIDLSGHTAGNRLPMFGLRPAPVQASWLGYWGTTGLPAMDYILSDVTTIPPGEERFYTEQVMRLADGRFCYQPPEYAPHPVGPPCRNNGYVTFGSFNNMAKVGPAVVRLWAAVLAAVPRSRLLVKAKALASQAARDRMTEAFLSVGLDPARLILRGASPHPSMLAEYGDIDIALDPFPFSGGLTSCESLWMGVPVVTLAQGLAPSRQTLGFLRLLGLEDLAASDSGAYLRIAAGLAADQKRLTDLRFSLRSLMAGSPLCDGATFTRNLEGAYRNMWRDWCNGPCGHAIR